MGRKKKKKGKRKGGEAREEGRRVGGWNIKRIVQSLSVFPLSISVDLSMTLHAYCQHQSQLSNLSIFFLIFNIIIESGGNHITW